MTTIWLARHGQTDWNAERRWQGQSDIPLNDRGRTQAQALAARLAGRPIQAIYSSDLRRAYETATIAAQALGLPVVSDPAWRERSAGVLEGMTWEMLRDQHPAYWEATRYGDMRPPGGESFGEVQARAVQAVQRLLERHPNGEAILVVSHGGTLRALICHVLGLPISQVQRLSVGGNASLSQIEHTPYGWRLTALNDMAHLEDLATPERV